MKFNVKTYVVANAIFIYQTNTGDCETFRIPARLINSCKNSVKTVSLTAEELDLLGDYL